MITNSMFYNVFYLSIAISLLVFTSLGLLVRSSSQSLGRDIESREVRNCTGENELASSGLWALAALASRKQPKSPSNKNPTHQTYPKVYAGSETGL